jgi:hypothetical protein
LPLAGVGVGALVVHARCDHLDRTGAGQHLPRSVVAVAHHQPPALLVELAGERRDVGIHLGPHPPGTLPHDLVDQRRTSRRTLIRRVAAGHYCEHWACLPDRRANVGLA